MAEQTTMAGADSLPRARQSASENEPEERGAVLHPETRAVARADVSELPPPDGADVHLRAASFRRMASLSPGPSPARAFVYACFANALSFSATATSPSVSQ